MSKVTEDMITQLKAIPAVLAQFGTSISQAQKTLNTDYMESLLEAMII